MFGQTGMNAKRRIVEATPSIHIREVRKAGAVPGMESVSMRAKDGFNEAVRLIWHETSFGGKRAYFECPHCFRGTETLYAAPFLACRKCHGLAYRSENLTKLWRKNEKLHKLQRQAGIDTSRWPRPFPPKPKWQRWHTYLNLRRAIETADREFSSAWLGSRCTAGTGLLQ
jgi:hypothetical protein